MKFEAKKPAPNAGRMDRLSPADHHAAQPTPLGQSLRPHPYFARAAAGAAAYDTVTGGANKVFVDTTGQAVLAEMVGTSLLVFTVFTVCDENKSKNSVGWFAIGLSVFLAHLALLGATNTSINPARSFGAAVVSDYWDSHWVWWVGPYLGAVLAAVLYEFFKARKGLDY